VSDKEMVELDVETSNAIFEVFEDWEYLLGHADLPDFEDDEETE
jgi:hypothetical protein